VILTHNRSLAGISRWSQSVLSCQIRPSGPPHVCGPPETGWHHRYRPAPHTGRKGHADKPLFRVSTYIPISLSGYMCWLTTRKCKCHKVRLRRMFTQRHVQAALKNVEGTLLDVRVIAYPGYCCDPSLCHLKERGVYTPKVLCQNTNS
jgi:hypothetical protein